MAHCENIVDSSRKGQLNLTINVFFAVSAYRLPNKQSHCLWFEMPWRPCCVFVMLLLYLPYSPSLFVTVTDAMVCPCPISTAHQACHGLWVCVQSIVSMLYTPSTAIEETLISSKSALWKVGRFSRILAETENNHAINTKLKSKCRHIDEISITGCIGSWHFDNFQCCQLWRCQNKDNFISVNDYHSVCSAACSVTEQIQKIEAPHYWPFAMWNHRMPVDSHRKGPMMRKCVSFSCSLHESGWNVLVQMSCL